MQIYQMIAGFITYSAWIWASLECFDLNVRKFPQKCHKDERLWRVTYTHKKQICLDWKPLKTRSLMVKNYFSFSESHFFTSLHLLPLRHRSPPPRILPFRLSFIMKVPRTPHLCDHMCLHISTHTHTHAFVLTLVSVLNTHTLLQHTTS